MIDNVNDERFQIALQTNEKVIVKFYADWCGSCKLFSPKYRRISEQEQFGNIAFLDVNAEENEMARKLAGVDNLPFFATFRSGKLIEATTTAKEQTVVEMIERLNK